MNCCARICSFALSSLLLLVSSCGPHEAPFAPTSFEEWAKATDRVRVLSTTAMIDDIVGHVGKDRIVHIPLFAGEIDPHSYELVKGDDEKLARAQVIFYNGLGLEHGASLRYQLQSHSHAIALGDAVKAAHPDAILSIDHEIDPHIWMDISLWSEIIPTIVQSLSEIDPEGASYFEANGDELLQQMLAEHEKVRGALQQVPAALRYLVTSHDAFNYYTRAYLAAPTETSQADWQQRFEAPEGLAPDGQLGATDIQDIVAHLAAFDIHVIFPESNVSRDSLKKILDAAQQKGLTVRIAEGMLYADAMGSKESGAGTYLEMIAHDAQVMIEGWTP